MSTGPAGSPERIYPFFAAELGAVLRRRLCSLIVFRRSQTQVLIAMALTSNAIGSLFITSPRF